jgi:hypothetical protein
VARNILFEIPMEDIFMDVSVRTRVEVQAQRIPATFTKDAAYTTGSREQLKKPHFLYEAN